MDDKKEKNEVDNVKQTNVQKCYFYMDLQSFVAWCDRRTMEGATVKSCVELHFFVFTRDFI
jgi:hypothetical protein